MQVYTAWKKKLCNIYYIIIINKTTTKKKGKKLTLIFNIYINIYVYIIFILPDRIRVILSLHVNNLCSQKYSK